MGPEETPSSQTEVSEFSNKIKYYPHVLSIYPYLESSSLSYRSFVYLITLSFLYFILYYVTLQWHNKIEVQDSSDLYKFRSYSYSSLGFNWYISRVDTQSGVVS